MTTKPTFMSLFSGVGGFDLGLERAGFECIAQCDNDPFCNKVLAKHWPGVKRYDDVRNIASAEGRDRGDGFRGQGRVDLICGGFPCQDLSVAGKRAGLDGARSGLWFEFHRILSELRPTFALIENVPGLLSSNQGRDFGIVLAGLGELWPAVGWAVLDSQHFGVAQRRRRVYFIAGPSRECVQQILSLCESGDWNTQARRAETEDTPGPVGGSAYGTGRRTEDDPNLVLANPLGAAETRFGGYRGDLDHDTYVPDVSPTLSRLDAKGPSSNVDQGAIIVAPDVAYSLTARAAQDRPESQAATLVTHSLRADGFDASEDGTGRGTPLTVIQDARGHAKGQNGLGDAESETMYTLDGASQHAIHQVGVRRLTPVECERLQGFPDDWTQLDDKTPDGPRYKALGNAVTVPVIEYIGLRMIEALQ